MESEPFTMRTISYSFRLCEMMTYWPCPWEPCSPGCLQRITVETTDWRPLLGEGEGDDIITDWRPLLGQGEGDDIHTKQKMKPFSFQLMILWLLKYDAIYSAPEKQKKKASYFITILSSLLLCILRFRFRLGVFCGGTVTETLQENSLKYLYDHLKIGIYAILFC